NPHAGVFGVSINMVAPFDNMKVRRALAMAIDRPRLLAILGGARLARPTCQVQPPNVPGYSSYCPFARDVARAKRLVRASGTTGMQVRVWAVNVGPYPAVARYVANVLNRLGYRASTQPRGWLKYS